ncbi:hypothetical protein M9H77_02882 [Catharanthus roseus]|uniref:Uncharacterized protein n=1 Tax=Catharanthus roseus TaxID=4058 RepID=A0ACC0C9U1_CATRO|nr:hypothetical protein M9H77_02882 [Catharanthus roseus]
MKSYHSNRLMEKERWKELLRKCPHRGLDLGIQILSFYNGDSFGARQLIDASAAGSIYHKCDTPYASARSTAASPTQYRFGPNPPTVLRPLSTGSISRVTLPSMSLGRGPRTGD